MKQSASKSKLIAALKRRKMRDHICLVYKSHRDQLAVAMPFTKIGLENGERCVYIADDSEVSSISSAMTRHGIDVNGNVESKALVITGRRDTCLEQESFDPDLMIRYLKTEIKEAKADGYPGVRMVYEMNWAQGSKPDIEKTLEYESKVNSFALKNNIIVLDMYDSSLFDNEFILDIVKTHPVVINREVVCDNFYYSPSDGSLKTAGAGRRVRRLLDNMIAHENNKSELIENKEWLEKLNTQLLHEISERKRGEAQIQLRAWQQEAVADLGQSALAGMDVLDLMDKAVDVVAKTLDVEFAGAFELQPSGENLILRAGVGWNKGLVGEATISSLKNSQAGYTLMTKTPVIVDDLNTETRFIKSRLLLKHNVISSLSIVIEGREKPFGVFGAHTIKQRKFNRDDFTFIIAVANVLSEAIERKKYNEKLKEFAANLEADHNEIKRHSDNLARANTELQKEIKVRKQAEDKLQLRAMEQEALSNISRLLIQVESLDTIFSEVPKLIKDFFGFDAIAIETFDKTNDEIVFMGSVGFPSEEGGGHAHEETDGTVSGDVVKTGKAIILPDIKNQCKYKFRMLSKRNIKTFACFPMNAQKRVIGTLCIGSAQEHAFETSTNIILQTIADTIAQTTERKNAEAELKQYHDHLKELVDKRTEQLKAAQDKLLHSEKLSAVGKLSASIAHEFNNPICGIRNVIERIRNKFADTLFDEEHKELVELAIKECKRVAELIRKLQDFNRPSSGISEPMDVNEAVKDMIMMSKKKLKERKISLVTDFSDKLPGIYAVSDQIKQVILNIIQNAEEAIPDKGGTISITTELKKTTVDINIKDTGSGIPPQFINTIFEPFFTTKPSVKGIGLGLFVSYGIIKKHGGNIEVKSFPGQGTTFTISLPIKANPDESE